MFGCNDAWEEIPIALIQKMREGRAEERTIHTVESRARGTVIIDAVGTEQLDRIQSGQITPTARKNRMTVTEHSRTVSEMARLVLVHHLLHSMPRQNVPLMDQAVQQFGRRLDDRDIGDLERVFLGWLYIQNHLERFLVEWYQSIETGQVKVVFDKVFANFGKVFVSGKGAEPRDPG